MVRPVVWCCANCLKSRCRYSDHVWQQPEFLAHAHELPKFAEYGHMVLLELPVQTVSVRPGWLAPDPVTRTVGVKFETQKIFSGQAHDQPDRSDYQIEHHAQNDRAGDGMQQRAEL